MVAAGLGPVLAAGSSLAAVAMVGTAAAAVSAVAAAVPAKAATGPSALVLLQAGETTAPETTVLLAAGYTVTQYTPAQWAAASTATFKGFTVLVMGDASQGGACSSLLPVTGTAGTGQESVGTAWQAAVNGNIAVAGTAPALAGTAGANALVTDAVEWAATQPASGSATGLYASLNCEYRTAGQSTPVPFLDGVAGIGAAGSLTVNGNLACTDAGMVNTQAAVASGTFGGLTSASLGTGSAAFPPPSCPMEEAFDSWPATFTAVGYDAATDASSVFTASDGVTGQPYILLGGPASSAATLALSPATGGQVPFGSLAGGSNAAAPGADQQLAAGGTVNTFNGDLTTGSTDMSVPTFGPSLQFTRTYDAQAAQAQQQTGTPGPMGYGWSDNWEQSLTGTVTMTAPVAGDIYALDGLAGAANTGDGLAAYAADGQAPGSAPLGLPGGVLSNGGNVYYSDTRGNRIEEVAGSAGTQWGIAMTAGQTYTIAGSYTGQMAGQVTGQALNGPARQQLLDYPRGLAMDSSGDLFIANDGGEQVNELTPNGNLKTVAGTGTYGAGADGVAATSSALNRPTAVAVDSAGNLYIADSANSRIQEVPAVSGTQWGQSSLVAGDIYTVAGSPAGTAGRSANGTAAASSLLNHPQGVIIDGPGNMFIADTANNRVIEIPRASATNFGIVMTGGDVYDVAGSAAGTAGHSGDGSGSTLALLSGPAEVTDSGGSLVISDTGNNRVQYVDYSPATRYGQPMTANDIYTIAGSPSGTAGNSGNGGTGNSALLDSPDTAEVVSAVLWVTDSRNNTIRQENSSTGVISAYAGTGLDLASAGNGGPAINGQLEVPGGETSDSHGDLYIADEQNNRVQEIAAYSHAQWGITMTGGDVYTIAGSAIGSAGNSGDGSAATGALLNNTYGLAFDKAGNLLISDYGNNQVRVVAAQGGTYYGQPMNPNDIYTIAGSTAATSGTAGDGGPAAGGLLWQPQGLAVDSHGDVYIADKKNSRVQEIFASGGQSWGQSMTAGDIYTVAGSAAGTSGDSGNTGPALSALLDDPLGVAIDGSGNLLIADTLNNQVREVPAANGRNWGQQMTARDIYTLAGGTSGTAGYAGNGGPAARSLLSAPEDLTLDPAGDIYIADGNNDVIRELVAVNGTAWGTQETAGDIYTIAGKAGTGSSTGDGGPATMATIYYAVSANSDSYGDLYIGDQSGGQLREVPSATPATIAPSPAVTYPSALYPPPGSTINGTTFPAGITIAQPGGAAATFYPKNAGTCTSPMITAGGYCAMPVNTGATLTANGTTSWTFTPSPGATSYTYSQVTSQLTAITDPAGNAETITYASPVPGQATTGTSTPVTCPATATSCDIITSASGRAMVIGSDANGRVTTVTDPMGRQWSYAYNAAGDLASATDPAGNTTTYSYDTANPSPLLRADLTSVTAPNGQPGGPDAGNSTSYAWDTAGRVTAVTDPTGNATTVSYCVNKAAGDCLNATTGTGYVTVTDPDGNSTVYDYSQGTLTAQATWTGATGTTLTSETDQVPDQASDGTTAAGTQLATATTDADGNITTYSYDSSGNPVAVTAPGGVGTQQATTTQQSTSLGQTDCSSDVDTITTCTASGGPAPVPSGGTISPPSAAPPQGITWTQYDALGNELWTTTGVYEPGSSTAAYSQTTYQLFNGNSVTLNSTSISCSTTAPSMTLPCATINADGVATQLAYNANGDLTSSSTPDGNSGGELATTTYGYDGDGERTSTTSPDGNLSGANAGDYTTITAWNSDGQETSVSQGDGTGHSVTPRVTSYGHDGDGNQTAVQDARGYTTTTTYSADDKPTLVSNPDGDATLTCYDGNGNTAQTVPAAGVAANSLTPSSCPTSYPSGYGTRLASDATTYTFNGPGQKTQMTTPAPAGQTGTETTTYSYDGNGNLTQMTAPPTSNGGSSQVTVNAYNSTGQLASQTTGYGTSAAATYSYCYDPDGDQTSVVYPDGNTSGIAPCEVSSPWVVSPTANPAQAAYQTTSSYDSAGELVSTSAPATAAAPSGATTTYTYDADANKLTSTDPDGVITSYAYAPGNIEASVTYSEQSTSTVGGTAGPLVSAVLPSTGRLCLDDYHSLTSAGNVIDISTCNKTGAQQWQVNPNATLQVLGNCLDASGNGTSSGTLAVLEPCSASTPGEIWRAGQNGSWVNPNSGMCLDDPSSTTTSGTQLQIWWCNGTLAQDWAGIQYRHDANGSMTAMSDASGTSSYVSDPFGEVTSATNGAGQATGYGYDANGNATSVTYPLPASATWASTSTVGYAYDHAGLLTGITDLNGKTIGITDTADGRPSSVTLGTTGDTIATTYDSTDTPSHISLNGGTTTLQSFGYADSPAGNIATETDTPTSPQTPATSYAYDAKGRVTSMTPGTGIAQNYGFDPSGNLTTLPGGATATYDKAGEFTSSALSGTTTSYAYDADGHRVTAAQGTTTVASGTWNGAGQLTAYSNGAASMSAASYDGSGLRASTTITPSGQSATSQQYVWNATAPVPEMIMDSGNAYIYGTGVGPIEQINLSTGAITYLLTDSLGSVRGAVSSSGALTGTTSYDAWGNPQTTGGLTATTPFGFAGGYTDPTGLIYLQARYYDPSTGQFLSVDPLTDQTFQPYPYANDNPVSEVDPSGEYGYNFVFYLGKLTKSIPTLVNWIYNNFNSVFPFWGCPNHLRLWVECKLDGFNPVEVIGLVNHYFELYSLPGHTEGPRKHIRFAYYTQSDGEAYMSVHAWGPNDTPCNKNAACANANKAFAYTEWTLFSWNIYWNTPWGWLL